MDLSRFGFRNIIGITMPGAILVLSVAYGLWAIGALEPPSHDPGAMGAALGGMSFFLISYALGSILSLGAPGRADDLSAGLIPWKMRNPGGLDISGIRNFFMAYDDAEDAWRWFHDTKSTPPATIGAPTSAEQLRNAWSYDGFPYPCWTLICLGFYQPKELFLFYWQHRMEILAQVQHSAHYFNYCKMRVYGGDYTTPNPLAAEIQETESRVRFLAGSCVALAISAGILVALFCNHWLARKSIWLLLLLVIPLAALVVKPDTAVTRTPSRLARGAWWCTPITSIAGVALGCLFLRDAHGTMLIRSECRATGVVILALVELGLVWAAIARGSFRKRRLSEVATVISAFYLVERQSPARGTNIVCPLESMKSA
jgi:hypothetical protein